MARVLDQFHIRGRAALITGAASGLGLAFAETLAEAGCAVTLVDLDAEGAGREAERLAQSYGVATRAAGADVRDRPALRSMFDDHARELGGLDIVFANAGVGGGPGFWDATEHARNPEQQLDTLDPARWDLVVGTNLTGAFNTVREAARLMKLKGRGGSIVVTSSNAALINIAMIAPAYMAAKAGVAHFVRHAALELAEHRIRVNAIAPGSFATNIAGGWMKNPAVRAAWARQVPLGAVADPEQIKPLALYLASDASNYMTGAQLVIDGGTALGAFS